MVSSRARLQPAWAVKGRMPSMEKDEIEAAVLLAIEVSLEAQLKAVRRLRAGPREAKAPRKGTSQIDMVHDVLRRAGKPLQDRKSTRLNSSHTVISYAVFCLKKK